MWRWLRIFGRPFVKRFANFALSYRIVVCLRLSVLSCLSVTLVYCGQTVGWTKMKLGMQVGLGPGRIVLDGTQHPHRVTAPPPNFRPISVGKRLMDQNATGTDMIWYDMIWYDMIWWTILTCAQKLTRSQLSLPHGTKQKRIMKKLKT